jgi:signal transduction histidine kinase
LDLTEGTQLSDLPLVAMLSHELLTPLAIIKAATDLLLAQDPDLDAKSLYLSIRHSEKRLEKLARKLLLAVEIETGAAQQRFEAESTRAELAPCIKTAVQQVAATAIQRNIAIAISLPPDLPAPTIHPEQLSDALTCLLDNAIKFSRLGGRVLVRAGSENGHVRIGVADGGKGIPADELPLLFQRFYQVDRRRNEQQGVGLGLYISRRLVEIHGGDIEVESTVGQGSTFTITLPVQ